MRSWVMKETHIGRIKLVAEILPYLSEPERFRGKDVLYFVDNTSAIYCSIKGYSTDADTAALVHLLHAVMCEMDVSVWFEYVPSAENIFDGPSRHESELLLNLGARRVQPVYPDACVLSSPSETWDFAVKVCSKRAVSVVSSAHKCARKRAAIRRNKQYE